LCGTPIRCKSSRRTGPHPGGNDARSSVRSFRQGVPRLDDVHQPRRLLRELRGPAAPGHRHDRVQTAGALWSTGTRRVQLYEAEFGQTGNLSSTDCQVQWDLSRFGATAVLTATAVVPNLLDIADSSPLAQFANNATTELTYTTAGAGLSLKSWAINQRGSYRWRALDDGDNIMVPATAVTGVGMRGLSSNFTASLVGNISFVER
jgi:hypothetical protein